MNDDEIESHVIAYRDIKQGEEITLHYGLDYITLNDDFVCNCATKKCINKK